jgi:peptide/nickel transport system ATP-binding protein
MLPLPNFVRKDRLASRHSALPTRWRQRVHELLGSINDSENPGNPMAEKQIEGDVLLSVRDLHVQFLTGAGLIHAVRGVSYDVWAGEIVALVGESGCGKSVSSLALMGLLHGGDATRISGAASLKGMDYFGLSEEQMRRLRGREIAMVFQEPMTALNPVLTIGIQIMEPMLAHLGYSREKAWNRAVELLTLVGVPDPERRLGLYPHQFSGGMRQRVMIAIALACNPSVIIADEPTTALDVTIQAQILDLLQDLVDELKIGLVLITHNLGLVARYADRVNVMYAGRIVEAGTTSQVLRHPRHQYTAGLLKAVPQLDMPRQELLETIPGQPPSLRALPEGCAFRPRCSAASDKCLEIPALTRSTQDHSDACFHPFKDNGVYPAAGTPEPIKPAISKEALLTVSGLTKHFYLGRGATVRAVENVSFSVPTGGTLGLVGESGCGKTTLARLLLRLEQATAGTFELDGDDLLFKRGQRLKDMRRKIQVVYQDPFTSLNPRHKVADALVEPLLVHKLRKNRREARERVEEALSLVGLPSEMGDRYPHQMSGGQRQRVGIARALVMEPDFIICDEPVSALDVSIQAQIMNLLVELQKKLGLTYLFIAHDLAVVRHISDIVAVMYLGRVVESGRREELFAEPRHPYTQALLAAVPSFRGLKGEGLSRGPLQGEIPSPLNPPSGCVFHTRCPLATDECRTAVPESRSLTETHKVACVRA